MMYMFILMVFASIVSALTVGSLWTAIPLIIVSFVYCLSEYSKELVEESQQDILRFEEGLVGLMDESNEVIVDIIFDREIVEEVELIVSADDWYESSLESKEKFVKDAVGIINALARENNTTDNVVVAFHDSNHERVALPNMNGSYRIIK